MRKSKLIIYGLLFVLVFFIVGSSFSIFYNQIFAATNATIGVSVKISVCGNGIQEGGEQCDGSDLAGQSCVTKGFTGGVLSCTPACIFNTSGCTSSSGGGGGGGYIPPSSETKIVFSGRAYPKSIVTLLKDAQIVATTIADSNANFQISLSGLSGGNYIFSIYSEDNKGNRSSLLTFPVSVTSGTITNIGGIFIAPTIAVDKEEVKKGDNIAIFGQSAPKSEVTVVISSEEEFFGKILADSNGVYLYNFDTAQLDMGQHFTKSKAALGGEISSFSKAIGFKVGTKNIFSKYPSEVLKGDLNNDNRVNLIDFSIAAYWYKRTISAEFATKELERLNGDGKVDLIDFSIIAFYWTG